MTSHDGNAAGTSIQVLRERGRLGEHERGRGRGRQCELANIHDRRDLHGRGRLRSWPASWLARRVGARIERPVPGAV